MDELCFICKTSLVQGDCVNVVRGLRSLKSASIERHDGHIDFLNTLASVTVHTECRKNYTNKNTIAAYKRRLEDGESSTSSGSRRQRVEQFDFKSLCLFCGEAADESSDKKKEAKYRRTIRLVSTLEFKDNLLRRAEQRGDTLGKSVKDRIQFEHDLVAAEGRYHSACYAKFLSPVPSGKTQFRDEISDSMEEIFSYIENNEDSQFTLNELKDIITNYVPDDKTIISRLQQKYLSNIMITTKERLFTIISFRDTQASVLSKAWYEDRKSNPKEERMRVIEAAAAIIREDIRSSVVETKSYPAPNKMLDHINEEIPETLLHFLEQVIMKNRRGKVDHLRTKCTAISHAIMSTMRERSFSSQLLLGLSVFLHRRYGSRRLVDILSSLGFAASYNNTIQYETSVVYHPQPRILSSESGALVQYVGDNADINVCTLDGNNTLHVMGMIKIVTPKEAVLYDERIKKCTSTPKAQDLAAISNVSLLIYEKPAVPGYSKIQVQNLNDNEVILQRDFNAVDFLWLFGKWRKSSPLPGWNGFLEQLTKNATNFSTSQIIFLPFIDNPASNIDTIYTTLHSAVSLAKSHNQSTCIITFDQPLYFKAREIIAASPANSQLSNVIVRLGGFHMLMSFLGCIGHVMDGSGLKEALSTIYAANSVDKMLSGHAYARSIRGHILLRLALSMMIFEDMNIEHCVLDELVEQVTSRDVSYEDLQGCVNNSSTLLDQFRNKLNDLKSRGPTAQLWVQYFEMVSIALDFVRAERLGFFQEHLNSVRQMLPYFHASGHFLYAKSAHLYLQDMLKLENTMDEQTYLKFQSGFFTIRRSDKFNSGTWTDMVIEQSLMKSMKSEGGISRGRSTKESVLCKWVYTMYATNTISEEIEKFCNLSIESVEQHVDARDSRVKRDEMDVAKLFSWLNLHTPFVNTNKLVSLASGIVGNDQVNCYRAHEIGVESMNKLTGLSFNEIKFKRADKVVPLSIVNKSIKIQDAKVSVDPLLLFQRISVSKKFESNLEQYLEYELSPYPTALFDNNGMRKTTKSTLYDCMKPLDIEVDVNNVTYIIDGGFLLHRVIWSKDDTFSVILDKYVNYLQRHYGSSISVVFDGYSDYTRNTKAMEQLRRTAALSKSYEVSFDESMTVPISQEKFLSNGSNKDKLIKMLVQKFEANNITAKQARDDADVTIIETAIEQSKESRTAVIVGEDIDLLVILIARTESYDKEIYLQKIGRGNVKTQLYSSKSLDHYPRSKKHILLLHAFSGCDTTSALYKKGKKNILKIFEKSLELEQPSQVFQQLNICLPVLLESGTRIFLTIYNAPQSECSIDHFRYLQFVKSTKFNRPVQLSNLPPSNAAAHQHIKRVYYQIQTWLGNYLEPQEWGWMVQNELLEPITTILPPAPDELLNAIFCNCKNGCGSRCGCRKAGLECSPACGQCNGQACLNASSYQKDLDQECSYDAEIVEGLLETDILDSDDDNEDDIVEQADVDDDDEEEYN